ncbi:glycoside hydrolase family 28 protein [Xylanibacter muris]|uniref:Glycoside hydrolase n=1 Tax=Xylanibacter muris TaxID=2736290 RepID=A0ABX2AMF6_9BACT|nr:glycosyl hydrolase family 28 protein [Xylanibacter muris]NPD92406.1 glycoside hydrolase [Xylanibacter muris]
MTQRTIFSLIAACMLQLTHAADYRITDYGAVNDTTKLSTEGVQRAIDACSKAGGGRVTVPTGMYKIGTIVLKSNVNLHLEHGATLYGSTSLADYKGMKSDYLSLRTQTETIQLIYADNVENVVIDGYGTIDGRGKSFKKLSWNDEGITRPHLLRIIRGRDIVVKDITLRNSGCWMQHYLACDRLRIQGIRVKNRNNYNNDALDIDGCHDVVVSGMIADSDDDGITLKSTSPRMCENVTICNCVVSSHCNAVKLGTETNGGFRNINISGITIKPSEDQTSQFFGLPHGISAVSLEIVDGGVLENVNVSNITAEGTESPIFIRLGNRARGYYQGQTITNVGKIRDVHIDNVIVRNAGNTGCSVTGLPGHPVEDIHISNVTVSHKGGAEKISIPTDEKEKDYPEANMWGILPAKGFFVRHARNVTFNNIGIRTEQPDQRPDFITEDVR